MENSYRFFENRACKYFPCHDEPKAGGFNCLFCFCPLNFMGGRCGGNFSYAGEKRVKDCSACSLPHRPEYYDEIISRLKKEAGLDTPCGAAGGNGGA